MKKEDNKDYNYGSSFLIVFALFLIFILSYLYFLAEYTSKRYIPKNNKITNLEVSFTTKDEVLLNHKLKMDDSLGIKQDPYSFKITNNSVDDKLYIVYLEDVFLKSNYEINNIRVNVEKNNISKSSRNLYRDNKKIILDRGNIKHGETIKYDMRFWVNDKKRIYQAYKAKIIVDGYNQ